jgi:hypothetical protein
MARQLQHRHSHERKPCTETREIASTRSFLREGTAQLRDVSSLTDLEVWPGRFTLLKQFLPNFSE